MVVQPKQGAFSEETSDIPNEVAESLTRNESTPQWGSFQTPQSANQHTQNQPNKNQKPSAQISKEDLEPQAEKPQWGNFKSPETYQGEDDPNSDEPWFDWSIRNATQYASRIAELALGRYGDIEKIGKELLTSNPLMAGGVASWAISELVGPEKWERMVKGPKGQEQQLPTSQQLQQFSEQATGGYTKPRGKAEAATGELLQDIASTFRGQSPTNRQAVLQHFVIPTASNAVKQIIKETGFGEDVANIAKAIVWFPLMLANQVSGPRFASDLMNQGRQGLPRTLQANVPRLEARLNLVANSPRLLRSDPRTDLARQQIARIEQDIANGQTNSQSLLTMYDGISAAKRNRGMFEMNATDQRFAIGAINEVRDVIRDEIMQVGANHPEALQNWQNGVRAWATIHQSRTISNWVESIAKGPYGKIAAGAAAPLFGIGSYAAYQAPLVGGAVTAGTAATIKTGQLLYRVWNDPSLREYYWDAINAAMNENSTAFVANYLKLNKKLEKESAKPINASEKGKKTTKNNKNNPK